MELTRQHARSGEDLLYPMMLIAAIAVIVFSVLGMASLTGWMPRGMVGSSAAVVGSSAGSAPASNALQAAADATGDAAPAFQCAECGVIETVREIERNGVSSEPIGVFPRSPVGQATGI